MDIKKLRKEILWLCEKQYRKGVQQGITMNLTEKEAYDFRFKRKYDKHISLHNDFLDDDFYAELMEGESNSNLMSGELSKILFLKMINTSDIN